MEENVLRRMFYFTRFNSTDTLNVKEENEYPKTQNDKYQARPSKSNRNVLVTPLWLHCVLGSVLAVDQLSNS